MWVCIRENTCDCDANEAKLAAAENSSCFSQSKSEESPSVWPRFICVTLCCFFDTNTETKTSWNKLPRHESQSEEWMNLKNEWTVVIWGDTWLNTECEFIRRHSFCLSGDYLFVLMTLLWEISFSLVCHSRSDLTVLVYSPQRQKFSFSLTCV